MDHTIYLHIKNDTLRKVRAEYIKFWSLYINIIYYIPHINDRQHLQIQPDFPEFQHSQQGLDFQKNTTF